MEMVMVSLARREREASGDGAPRGAASRGGGHVSRGRMRCVIGRRRALSAARERLEVAVTVEAPAATVVVSSSCRKLLH